MINKHKSHFKGETNEDKNLVNGFALLKKLEKDKYLCIAPECGHTTIKTKQTMKTSSTGLCRKCSWELPNTYSHGKARRGGRDPTYNSWKGMRERCMSENHIGYEFYGGRGITVCERWLQSFENFLEDMGEKPKGMSLDRIDSDGNYEPSNCRWSDKFEQARNKRRKGGVKSHQDGKGYIVTLGNLGRRYYLGYYLDEELAWLVRDEAYCKIVLEKQPIMKELI